MLIWNSYLSLYRFLSLFPSAGASRSPSGTDPLQSTETECKNGLKCEHKCIAYEGKPQCMCRDGYQLHMNGYSCVGESRTSLINGAQSFLANAWLPRDSDFFYSINNNPKVWFIACWTVSFGNIDFLIWWPRALLSDIDECRYSPCSQLCTNTPGSFSCSCRAGFDLQSDKTTCQGKAKLQKLMENC